MNATILQSTILMLTKPSPTPPAQILPSHRHGHRSFRIIASDTSSSDAPPPEAVEIRFRLGSRRRSRQLQQLDGGKDGVSKKAQASTPLKEWEEMSIAEKAIELYVGEKGALFWLNKFAYASIFVMIGAWIMFRFVGPALNLYQLDTPPLSPSSVFKGS